ncbi:putative spermidine/putrescine transport system permease protein/spermidine/putrescine transport system permease protein [Haladaptatus litoreus]|uniref:Putative spermidine/putrescine transport system permease protein/spermidine/putrescine transport system permease protein n=1 Tax=Haladaptatus litoreus TaxID=553468 RepID=A0A1N7CHK1_9EURY|nr:ABC transporter permease [Haladaptatus litoreus]SIR63050.1 putative spermidine/putrescine transport system permease protein/spermidine/putrescine transport system permease protein [Haladaptatus litoreus]
MSYDNSETTPVEHSESRGVDYAPQERLPSPLRPLIDNDRLRFGLEVVPWLALFTFFVFLPLAAIFIWSVAIEEPFGMELGFTLDNYRNFVDSYRLSVFWTTVKEGLLQVALALLFGFPIAYYAGIRKRHSPYTFPLLLLFAIPFLTSYILRTLSWIAFLGSDGVINTVLMMVGLISEPLGWLLYSTFAVRLSLMASYLPFMIFPAWLAMSRIDDEILQASADIGGSPLATVRHIVLPLSLPGLVIGSVFVFVGVLGESVVPVVLGGGNISLVATVIDNAVNSLRLPLASAISAIVLLFAIGLVLVWDYVFGLDKVGEI